MRPDDIFDREHEWEELDNFASIDRGGFDLGVVLGRRRQGKSYRLRRLVAAHGGVYSLALEEERLPALRRFGRSVAEAEGLPAELRLDDWVQALRLALGLGQPGRGNSSCSTSSPICCAARPSCRRRSRRSTTTRATIRLRPRLG